MNKSLLIAFVFFSLFYSVSGQVVGNPTELFNNVVNTSDLSPDQARLLKTITNRKSTLRTKLAHSQNLNKQQFENSVKISLFDNQIILKREKLYEN